MSQLWSKAKTKSEVPASSQFQNIALSACCESHVNLVSSLSSSTFNLGLACIVEHQGILSKNSFGYEVRLLFPRRSSDASSVELP
mmetsp:Transcript_25958/g.30090  ORF Transcript_25958/g.30090 Transcript_25958/m.30090 type:complete len:85 (+) Transcript_25958:365-619(+)